MGLLSCGAGNLRGLSRVATGTSGNLSCCDSGVRHLLELQGAPLVPFESLREIGPPLELKWGNQGSSPVVTGISGFLWSFNWGVRPHLVFRHGTPFSSQVEKGVSGLLLS